MKKTPTAKGRPKTDKFDRTKKHDTREFDEEFVADALAEKKGISRANLIARGLRAVLVVEEDESTSCP